MDVTGTAVDVAEHMRVMGEIREAATGSTGMSFVNAPGRRVRRISMSAMRRATGSRDVELARGSGRDLRPPPTPSSSSATRSPRSPKARTEWTSPSSARLAGPSTSSSRPTGCTPRFDGWFGPESGFVRHLRLYVGTSPVDGPLDHGRDVVMRGAPGRLVTISPTHEGALAFFAIRSPELTDLDFRDSEQHKRVLAGAFANGSWRVPGLLDRVREADDIYFDSVSQVALDRWSSGRAWRSWGRRLLGVPVRRRVEPGDLGRIHPRRAAGARPRNHERAIGRDDAEHRKGMEPKERSRA
jgi:hypothetical protein